MAATSRELHRAPFAPGGAALRWAVLLAAATLVVDVVGSSQTGSTALAISAVQSGSQGLMLGAAVLVVRHRSRPAASPSFDPLRAEALARFVGGLVLLVLSMPIAYRALGAVCLPSDCDAGEPACILALGLCSSGLSAWLLLRAEPGRAPAHGAASARAAAHRAMPPLRGDRRGFLAAAAAYHGVDVQISAFLLLATLVSGLCGWAWVDGAAGLTGSLMMSYAGAHLVVRSGEVLIDARAAE